jgi:hypothetical protein
MTNRLFHAVVAMGFTLGGAACSGRAELADAAPPDATADAPGPTTETVEDAGVNQAYDAAAFAEVDAEVHHDAGFDARVDGDAAFPSTK